MQYNQKITKIGNSLGIVIPKTLLNSLNLKQGEEVILEEVMGKIVLNTHKSFSVSPEFLKIAEEVGKKYKKAFKELA
jgi:putative addiction module antidote